MCTVVGLDRVLLGESHHEAGCGPSTSQSKVSAALPGKEPGSLVQWTGVLIKTADSQFTGQGMGSG